MIILELETGHYRFVAAGKDEAQARASLAKATAYHAEQRGLSANWVDHYDVNSFEIQPGECWRDGQLLYRPLKIRKAQL